MTRCFPGTVLLEGTTLSEGRGTTTPLEVAGAPDIPVDELISLMEPQSGIRLRPCCFTPVFHKHVDALCQGFSDTHRFTGLSSRSLQTFPVDGRFPESNPAITSGI